jgi:ABC-type glycerol-3-phosphate transport system substrate-binding protein
MTVPSGSDYYTWLKTKMASASAPDLCFVQYADVRGSTFPTGTFTDLNPYLAKPNTYVVGNPTWKSLFYPNILSQIQGNNGEQFVIDGDYVATAIFYNKDMFAKAGITTTPTNWNQFLNDCAKLKAAGYTPTNFPFGTIAANGELSWWARLFLTNYYANDFSKLSVTKNNPVNLTADETAVAVKNGYFSGSDPRWLGWWTQLKDLMNKYMPANAMSAATTTTTVQTQFLNKQIAMYFDGSWSTVSLTNDKPSFQWASFPFPTPMKGGEDPYATSFDSANAIGGPSAAFQYGVPTKRANASLSTDKLNAVIDWLMYISTPTNNGTIVNDLGEFVPLVKGAKPLPSQSAIVAALNNKALWIDGGTMNLSSQFQDQYNRVFQQFMQGSITLKQANSTMTTAANTSADAIIKASTNKNLSQYITKK